ncbi:unnamed protein product [Paramecium pentaurelia]|uniref:Tetratricopeptide repeat protein n=1 Tax=Paramecium pentaurelia TaxID=43138 RepID=A0A8S1VWF0_9CILI|nr:unnamed protein product [Paramecium pentaurelia]
MRQQLNTKLQCQQQCHQEDVDMVCYNKFCTELRLNCFNCIKKGSHKSHIDDVQKINTIVAFIENQNKQCDNLIDNLNTLMKSVNQSFSQLKNGIKNKYSLLKERLENLNSQQVNDFLKSTFEFPEYKQSIIHIIQEQSNQLTQTFGSLHQQLQLLSINYDKIDDKDIKLSKELYDQGFQLYLDDKYREAIQILKKSLQSDPNNNLSLWCQGECLSRLDKYESAINQLDQELALDPKMLIYYGVKVFVYQDKEKMIKLSFGQTKLQPLILSILNPYALKANAQDQCSNTKNLQDYLIKHSPLTDSMLHHLTQKENVQQIFKITKKLREIVKKQYIYKKIMYAQMQKGLFQTIQNDKINEFKQLVSNLIDNFIIIFINFNSIRIIGNLLIYC